jgi:ankyrin repeat protein
MFSAQVKARHPTHMKNGLLLELDGEGSGVLCGCLTSSNERLESVNGFQDAILRQSAYVLANDELIFPSKNGLAYRVMLVERNEEVPNMHEAWVYLIIEVSAMQKYLSAKPTPWLILHESPISTHDRSGKGHSKIARLMSDEKALHGYQTPLHVAAGAGDEATVKELLATSKQYISAQDARGWTPLHVAAFSGQALSIRLLLDHGASVDAEDFSERSPLMIAADEGRTDAVKELLKHGADVNLSHKNAQSPLNQALLRSHVETVKVLLNAGANPESRDQFGFAPLLLASGKDVQLVELLISAGADPSADLVGGATVLHFAARAGNVALIERLLDLGMPVDLPGEAVTGETALYCAVNEQEEAAVSTLLRRGANPNHAIDATWTCVLQAANIGNYNIMKMLVNHGADIHATCQPRKWTALHIACREGHRLVVKLLLDAGWEVNARDASRATPLQLADSAGHKDVVEVLLRAGGT